MIETFPKEWNIIPIKSGSSDYKENKKPLVNWRNYQEKIYPRTELKKREPCNYAVICGKTSNNLLILDWDFKEDHKYFFETLYQKYSKEFPELADTYIVETPHGFHLYYYMDDFLETRHPKPNHISKFVKKIKKDVFEGVIQTKYYEHLAGWDVLGQKGYALIPPSKNIGDNKYTVYSNADICKIDKEKYKKVKRFFLLDKIKEPRQPFVDIMNGVIEIETYSTKTGQKEFVYWKNVFREMWHYCGMEPHEVYKFLEKNQDAFDKKECDVQLGHHLYTDNPLSNEYMKKYFPNYYTQKTTIKKTENQNIIIENTGIILDDLGNNIDLDDNQNDAPDKYEIRDIVLNNYNIKVIIENGEFCLYEDGVYLRYQKRRIKSIIKNFLEEFEVPYTNTYLRDVLELLENDYTLVSIKEFDKNPYILNLKNGLLDIKTLELKKHTPDYICFRRIPVIYDSKAICPTIDSFFEDVFKEEDIGLIYEINGLCLTPDMDFQRAFLFWGTGNNGKTTYFNLMVSLIGESNCSDVDLSELQKPFLASQLENKTLNILPDIDSSTKLKIQGFKNYVGNASFITVDVKYKDAYKTNPTAKLMYSCNMSFPLIPKDTDKGFYRKWITIECPNEFDKNEDLRIFERLIIDKELSGLLNKSIEGLKNLMNRERFKDKYNDWEAVKDLWLLKINIFAEFILKEAEVNFNYKADKTYTLEKFNKYLSDIGKKPVTKTMVTKFINESPNYHVGKSTVDKKRVYHYIGFRLEGDPLNKQRTNIEKYI